MKSRTITFILANIFVFCFGISCLLYRNNHLAHENSNLDHPIENFVNPIKNKTELPPIKNDIVLPNPSYMNYDQTIAQLKQWCVEAPEMAEIGVYGKTTKGKDCYYLRVFNKRYSQITERPKVLITACIHGNEPLASSVTMWYIGNLLSSYGKDDGITHLLDSRDLYFVPVVSPDSYPVSRIVDGVDPNRDFPSPNRHNHKSVAPVQAIQDLFMKIKPNAVISGHTWGRVYLTPYGDKMQNCPDHEEIMTVMNKVKSLSGYRCMRTCDMYNPNGSINNPPIRTNDSEYVLAPIYGTEVDWYYRNGAFAIVCEYGTHQRIPTDADTRLEFDKTFQGFLLFLKEAPLVHIKGS